MNDQIQNQTRGTLGVTSLVLFIVGIAFVGFGFVLATMVALSDPYASDVEYAFAGLLMFSGMAFHLGAFITGVIGLADKSQGKRGFLTTGVIGSCLCTGGLLFLMVLGSVS
jgi:hypothetical protein